MSEPINREKQISSAFNFLLMSADKITNPILKKWCYKIATNSDFILATGSKTKHHAYLSGLMIHTAEVMQVALGIASAQCLELNKDVIIAAIFFHDYGKIFDYVQNKDGTFEFTQHKELVNHLSRSFGYFQEKCAVEPIPNDLKLQIEHAILAHHGLKEWGSPVTPKTPEAWAVHCADRMSADAAKDYWTL